jgi:hypothetical protein
MPFPLRFPLAFDGKLLGHVVRIFTDTVSTWYRHRVHDLPDGETGAVTVIQRAGWEGAGVRSEVPEGGRW